MKIVNAQTAQQVHEARLLFQEYGASLPFDRCFQNFEQELADLPGEYGSPSGRLLLAITENGAVAGCVALRQWARGIGEMKRLFVRPAFPGMGIGKKLALAVLEAATDLGYRK